MAEKGTIFEQIKDKIDELIMGRRYIISEVGKMKVAVDKLQGSLPNVADLDKWLMEVRSAVSGMGQLSSVLNQLADSAGAIQSMNMSMDSVKKSISGIGDLRVVSENITASTAKIGGITESIREVRDAVRGLDALKEDFAANLGIMGELNISMSGLKSTMDTLSSKFEGLAGLADLGKVAKDLKPAIDELKNTMSAVGFG
jgi:methyl-accepting chemotaxis protein